LYNVVVDNEVTSRRLLNEGKLSRRTTFIPLNKIQPRVPDAKTVQVRVNVLPALQMNTFTVC
jgi:structural maintenance of chromosome 2